MADHFVCRCKAYRFPHEIKGGKCTGAGWLVAFHSDCSANKVCRTCCYHAAPFDGDCYCEVAIETRPNLTHCDGYLAEAKRQGVKP